MKIANEKIYSLQLEKYSKEQKALKEAFKKIDEASKNEKKLDVSILPIDLKKLESESDKLERRKQWNGFVSKDIYIIESCHIVDDMIKQKFMVKGV